MRVCIEQGYSVGNLTGDQKSSKLLQERIRNLICRTYSGSDRHGGIIAGMIKRDNMDVSFRISLLESLGVETVRQAEKWHDSVKIALRRISAGLRCKGSKMLPFCPSSPNRTTLFVLFRSIDI